MRSFVIESNGTYLGEIRAGNDSIDIDSRPLVLAEYTDGIRVPLRTGPEPAELNRWVRIVGVTNPEGETLIPPRETEPIQAMVYYGQRV